jgi:hypothetical protein
MEDSIREAGKLLNCRPDRVLEVLKEKVMSFERIEDLTNQRDKEFKQILVLGREVTQLNEETSRLRK